jgi:hypothetical protein
MVVICSSETSVEFQRTTRRCAAEDTILQNILDFSFIRVPARSITYMIREIDGFYSRPSEKRQEKRKKDK